MGKAGDAEQAVHSTAPAAGHGSAVRRYAATIGGAVDAKCVLVLFLSIGVFVLVLFMLLPLHDHASETIPDDDPGVLPGEIQASFFLLKKRQQLIPHVRRLQKDIYREIGIPNTTILGFPGGITVPPPPDGNICPTALFNVTLNMTIQQLRVHLKELESELRIILQLTPYEDLIVEITNENGSTINLPVTVHILIAPNYPSNYLETYRLKQLAQIIIKLIPKNLDLNPIFGMIENLWLSPCLQSYIPSCAPNPAPAPAPSLSPSNPEHPQPTTTKPYGSFSCPALERRKTVSVHRRLSTISPMMVPPEIPTRFDSWSVHTDRKNRSPLAKPMSLRYG
uniref:DUF7036 domain-containing protein n=1 Tax=Oryza nivara TaxID=4536 RepID=A0A0E0GCE1_ORYNI